MSDYFLRNQNGIKLHSSTRRCRQSTIPVEHTLSRSSGAPYISRTWLLLWTEMPLIITALRVRGLVSCAQQIEPLRVRVYLVYFYGMSHEVVVLRSGAEA
jgi:hypothetical protein